MMTRASPASHLRKLSLFEREPSPKTMSGGAIDLHHALSQFSDHWSPRRIATLNDYDVRIAKIQGSFVWHKHDDTDELFLVLSGKLTIQFRPEYRENAVLGPNQLFVVPKGVEHCPRTDEGEEVAILLVEPRTVVNTGDAEKSEMTKEVVDL
ncbi:putative PFAM Cupin 2, conserved barrel domain protein [Lyophyllum shimeji]|uniref:PFAM Cupin 2, conserved barrel domain protein n=1 Tax=Lyophyllum shimeji TaxID=47721 RepID=A0A9P3PW10_LYOSH|nr:putative PFAM Cupin 2, conserved barrel domain protein [Lyophyllum shimeji]